MSSNTMGRARSVLAGGVLVLVAAAMGVGGAGAVRSVRGFDGTTVTVGQIGYKAQLSGAGPGAEARIKRFNDTNEIKGIKIKYTEFADDQRDPATTLSELRRLVTQVGVFAIVGDVSITNPADYYAQQHVPYFGGGFDTSYCSTKPSTKLWGFSIQGCVQPQTPSKVSDNYRPLYEYVSKKTGKQHPTLALFGQDSDSGRNGIRVFTIAATGTGFDVTSAKNIIPSSIATVNDWAPYANQVINGGKNGAQPDAINCVGGTECINMWTQLKAQGYKGIYSNGLYSDLLVNAMAGSVIANQTNNMSLSTPGIDQMKADLDAFQAGLSKKVDLPTEYGYASTDMFIAALKQVAAKGKSNITPENVQKVAATMKWSIPGLQGPAQYPQATVMTYPSCAQVSSSDGRAWTVQVPYACSTKQYPPTLKQAKH
jgi:ABC-type branched-subunit amino acid transport system substrate-binding protein